MKSARHILIAFMFAIGSFAALADVAEPIDTASEEANGCELTIAAGYVLSISSTSPVSCSAHSPLAAKQSREIAAGICYRDSHSALPRTAPPILRN